MTNEYEVAAVIEIGNVKDVVLGEKNSAPELDSLTSEFGMRYVVATEE